MGKMMSEQRALFSRVAVTGTVLLATWLALHGCRRTDAGQDAAMASLGAYEITARLGVIPAGAIIERDFYNYATVLKYEVVQVHRGDLQVGQTIYVAHYNPFKGRGEAADDVVKNVGGNVPYFEQSQLHRMALQGPARTADEFVLVAEINKFHAEYGGTLYWALRANLVVD